ncbi:MAG: OmpH family outer membrane protein [Phycisphaeraceae bacterium]
MHTSTIRRGLLGGLMAVALAAGAAVVTTPSVGQAQEAGGDLRVGTYDPEQVFGAYHGREAFMQQFQELQTEAQAAQQEGNQEQLMQIQQQLQQAQQEVIETFQGDVEEVMPDVAEDAGVQIVAVEVVYTAEGINSEDVTNQVIEKLNEGHDAPEPIVPEMGVE